MPDSPSAPKPPSTETPALPGNGHGPPPPPAAEFPVVGIGMSAGGLDALEALLSKVPPACGMSFVIVQHLDPAYKCMLVELLQRVTPLPVVEITDDLEVERNQVYVLPPNYDVSLRDGRLYLTPALTLGGLRLPIDHFFRSLATDRQQHGIGVILSGMGSDGTLGVRAIKEGAGSVFVQAPETAKFDSMPRSVIDAGLADVVAPPEQIPQRVLSYLQHLHSAMPEEPGVVRVKEPSGLERIVRQLHAHTGHDFSLYKKNTLYRRIERRMSLHQITAISDYASHLRENPHELELLFRELLIGVTRFFRDAETWQRLANEVIPALIAARPEGGSLRAWVPGCSTGEEAYSLAIVFCEALQRIEPPNHYTVQIFATDLDRDAIDRARTGMYPLNIRADVSEERLRRFFTEDEFGFRVRSEVREKVTFAPQNLVMDPPFTRLDMVSCRNVLIYLELDLQKKLLALFHYSLRPDGFLVLGAAETVGDTTRLFVPLPGKANVYLRLDGDPRAEFRFSSPRGGPHGTFAVGLPSTPAARTLAAPNFRTLTESMLMQHYCPAAVLTNDAGDIVYISGKTGKYLEPAAGKANLNVFAMAREGLDGALNGAFFRALRQKVTVTMGGIAVGGNGGTHFVDLALYPVSEPGLLRDMMLVTFADSAPAAAAQTAIDGIASHLRPQADLAVRIEELARCREELQATRQEMQTSQEELRSVNEELQSANEELHSANEELTTSKEEIQSMNEELQTINHELRRKVDQLWQVDDDMQNLLNSTAVAALFLDDELRVRRFTSRTTTIFKLIPADTGRPITDLVTELDYPALTADVREVLRSLVIHDGEVAASGERRFVVRITPYRTQDNHIDGVVIVFVDVTAARLQRSTLNKALEALQQGMGAAGVGTADGGTSGNAQLARALSQVRSILEQQVNAASQ